MKWKTKAYEHLFILAHTMFCMKSTPGLFTLFIILFITACSKQEQHIDNDIPYTASFIWKTAGVAGQVTDQKNVPVQGAMVSFGNKSVMSDINGYFHFSQSSFNTNEAFVSVKKTGYFNGSRTFLPRSGSNNYLKIQLLESTIAGTVNAVDGGRISLSNGAVIDLPANGISDSENKNYAGKVTVSAAYIDPTHTNFSEQMPGDLRGLNAASQQKLLKSFGMIAVELRSSSDKLLKIRNGYQAKLEFPVPAVLIASAPSEIPLWFFDENSGMWKEEGKAGRQGTKYIGMVSHFSFWNVDEPSEFIKLNLKVVNRENKPVSGAKTKITGLNGISAYDFTDNLGYVDGFVPRDQPLLMEVFDNCGKVVFSKDLGTLSSDADLGTIQLSSGEISLQTISGKVIDCNGSPLTSGTVQIILDENHFEFTAVHDGDFSATFLNCNSGNIVQLLAIDEGTMQRGSPVSMQLTGTETEVGTLEACGVALPPFVKIFIDGVEQLPSSTVFGGGIESDGGFGDNSVPLAIFKGDTTFGARNKEGLELLIKVFTPVNLPDSATLISISDDDRSITSIRDIIWYQATDQYNRMVKLYSFGDYGKIIQGDFAGKFAKLKGCCPDSVPLDTVTIQGSFRIKNVDPWWPN